MRHRLRPAPGVALGGQLAGRVDARLAAPELLVRGVVEVVDRPLGEQQVAGVVDVAERAERDLGVVVHVAVVVDDHDQLGQRHQVRAPDRVHHLLRVLRVALVDRDDRAVVEDARPPAGRSRRCPGSAACSSGRKIRSVALPIGRGPPAAAATDDRLVDRVALHRHALDVQRRERLDRRVEAGVVAERALRAAARPAPASPRGRSARAPAPAAARSGSRPSRPARRAGTRRTGTRRCRRAAARWPRR